MEALTGAMNAIVAYLPNVLAAIGILLVGWLIAILLRRVVTGLVRRTPLNAWLGRWFGDASAATPVDAAQVVGDFVYYLALLVVFIGVCEALQLTLITEPLRLLLGTVLAYLPRVLGAVVLLLVACLKCSNSVQLREHGRPARTRPRKDGHDADRHDDRLIYTRVSTTNRRPRATA